MDIRSGPLRTCRPTTPHCSVLKSWRMSSRSCRPRVLEIGELQADFLTIGQVTSVQRADAMAELMEDLMSQFVGIFQVFESRAGSRCADCLQRGFDRR